MGKGDGHGEGAGKGSGTGRGNGSGKGAKRLCKTTVAIFLFLGFFSMCTLKVFYGATNLENCPLEKKIPIVLIVSGIIPILPLLGATKVAHDGFEAETSSASCFILTALLHLAGLICGSMWIFGNYASVMSNCPGMENCCDQYFMERAFIITIVDWVVVGFSIFTVIFMLSDVSCPPWDSVTCSCSCCKSSKVGSDEASEDKLKWYRGSTTVERQSTTFLRETSGADRELGEFNKDKTGQMREETELDLDKVKMDSEKLDVEGKPTETNLENDDNKKWTELSSSEKDGETIGMDQKITEYVLDKFGF